MKLIHLLTRLWHISLDPLIGSKLYFSCVLWICKQKSAGLKGTTTNPLPWNLETVLILEKKSWEPWSDSCVTIAHTAFHTHIYVWFPFPLKNIIDLLSFVAPPFADWWLYFLIFASSSSFSLFLLFTIIDILCFVSLYEKCYLTCPASSVIKEGINEQAAS